MVIATLTLARRWESGLVEAIGLILGVILALGWVTVLTGTFVGLRAGPGRRRT